MRGSLVWLLLIPLACAPRGRAGHYPREKLFPPLAESVAAAALGGTAELHVLYWPAGGCQPCNLPAMRALADLAFAHPEISVTTVVPEGFPSPAAAVGLPWPGRSASLSAEAYRQQMVLIPVPRIEVWDPSGQLLLLRSLPPNAVQAEAIGEEVLWAKALAKPSGGSENGVQP